MHHFLFLHSSRFPSSIPRTIYCRVSGRLEKSDSHQRAAYSIQGRMGDIAVLHHSPFRLSSFSRKVCLAISGRPAKPQHYLHSFHLLVYASPHPSFPPIVTPSTPVFLQRTRSTTSVPFCVYRIRSILFFTLSYSLNSLSTIRFVVGRFLAFSVPYPHRANRFFVLLLSLSFAQLSAHPSSSLLQQSLYHIELCLQLHLQSEGLNGCFQYTGSALIFSENGIIGAGFSPVGRPSEQGWSTYLCTAKDHFKYPVWRLGADNYKKLTEYG